jgi:predicted NodU family carbamoyl transferase
VYWGPSLGSDDEVGALLTRWRDFIEAEPSLEIVERAADLIAAGQVIG